MERLHKPEAGLLVLRLGVGLIFFLHGWMKLTGQRDVFVQEVLHMVGWSVPDIVLWGVTLLELLAGLALVLGLLVRPAAALLALEMLVVVTLFHVRQGFFIIAVPNVPLAYGFEYHIALISGLICIALGGPGAWALDRRFARSAPRQETVERVDAG